MVIITNYNKSKESESNTSERRTADSVIMLSDPICYEYDISALDKNSTVKFTLLLVAGFITVLLNVIEITILIKKGSRKSAFEVILLSLGFADTFAGLSLLTIGFGRLSYFLQPATLTTLTKTSSNLYVAGQTLLVFSIWASFVQILLITVERFMAVYFPIRHRTLTYARKQASRIAIFSVWIFAVGMGHLFYFKCRIAIIISVGSTLILSIVIMIIYGLIAQKMILTKRKLNRPDELRIHHTGQHLANNTEFLVVVNSITIIAFSAVCSTPWIVITVLRLTNAINVGQSSYSLAYYILASSPLWDPLIYFFFSRYRKRNVQSGMKSKNIPINSL